MSAPTALTPALVAGLVDQHHALPNLATGDHEIRVDHEGAGVMRVQLVDSRGELVDEERYRLLRVHTSTARIEDQP